MTQTPLTIFESDDLGGPDAEGYEVSVAISSTGAMTHVAFFDHERQEMVETPVEVAVAMAHAILAAVRDPTASVH